MAGRHGKGPGPPNGAWAPPPGGEIGPDVYHRDGAPPSGWASFPGLSPLAQAGFSAYGGQLIGQGSHYLQSNVGRYLSASALGYYFAVDGRYVAAKLRCLLCPPLHRGSWMRVPRQVANVVTYEPPVCDVNAPDLYLPVVALLALVVARGWAAAAAGHFRPQMVGAAATRCLLAWGLESLALWAGLRWLATPQAPLTAPLLDLVAYAGYGFVHATIAVAAGAAGGRAAYWAAVAYGAGCSALFLVKTLKRILAVDGRLAGADASGRASYVQLGVAVLQPGLMLWLSA